MTQKRASILLGDPPTEDTRTIASLPLQIIFMGTPALAARILEHLVAASGPNFAVVAVVTNPDEPQGRGLKVRPSEVALAASRHGLKTLKPTKLKDAEFLAQLKSFDPDLILVAAYGRILPGAVLEAARIMPINVHASLLPRHRGAAPVEAAILAGDSETGVTIMRMTERMDAGPMLLSRSIPIAPGDTQGSLKQRLAELGAQALLEVLALLLRGELSERPQDEAAATYTKPVKKEDAIIGWSADAVYIERMTRAYDPWPLARTTLNGEQLLVYRARVLDPDARGEPGAIVALKPAVAVQCARGVLALIEVQAPGRKRMAAEEFMRGRRIGVGQKLGG